MQATKIFFVQERTNSVGFNFYEIFFAFVVKSHVRQNFFGVGFGLDLLILLVSFFVDKNVPIFATAGVAF